MENVRRLQLLFYFSRIMLFHAESNCCLQFARDPATELNRSRLFRIDSINASRISLSLIMIRPVQSDDERATVRLRRCWTRWTGVVRGEAMGEPALTGRPPSLSVVFSFLPSFSLSPCLPPPPRGELPTKRAPTSTFPPSFSHAAPVVRTRASGEVVE